MRGKERYVVRIVPSWTRPQDFEAAGFALLSLILDLGDQARSRLAPLPLQTKFPLLVPSPARPRLAWRPSSFRPVNDDSKRQPSSLAWQEELHLHRPCEDRTGLSHSPTLPGVVLFRTPACSSASIAGKAFLALGIYIELAETLPLAGLRPRIRRGYCWGLPCFLSFTPIILSDWAFLLNEESEKGQHCEHFPVPPGPLLGTPSSLCGAMSLCHAAAASALRTSPRLLFSASLRASKTFGHYRVGLRLENAPWLERQF